MGDVDYYDTEQIAVIALYELRYKRGSKGARQDALSEALRLPKEAGGAGPHGSFGATLLHISHRLPAEEAT